MEVSDGEAALAELAYARFDPRILELDLPERDGVSVVLMHRVLLAYQQSRSEPPAIIFTLTSEVRGNATLIEHLRSTFGITVAGFIDDAPVAPRRLV